LVEGNAHRELNPAFRCRRAPVPLVLIGVLILGLLAVRPDTIDFSMSDVCHTFQKGHRITVQVQSSWFPLTDRNPQRFMDIPKAEASDFQTAVARVYFGGREGSRIRVLVLE